MDIKNIIAQASAPHMQRIGTAIDDLRVAIEAANADGFTFRLKFAQADNAMDVMAQDRAVAAVLDPTAQPVLEYKATIQEAPAA